GATFAQQSCAISPSPRCTASNKVLKTNMTRPLAVGSGSHVFRGFCDMTVRTRLLAGAAALLIGAAFAPAGFAQQVSGPYVLGGVGINGLQDADVEGGGVNSEAEFDTGWGALAALGHGYGNGLRTEAEIAYRRNGIDKVGGTDGDGKVSQWSLMGN